MFIKFKKLVEAAIEPQHADIGSAGWDLATYYDIRVEPHSRLLVKLGFAAQIHVDSDIHHYQFEIRPRSGLALKKGLTVLNSPGTIDQSYVHEWGVILFNTTDEPIDLKAGDRIAQCVLMPFFFQDWIEVDELNGTSRVGGFGSTGS